ncbi:MAG: metal dependent phosphohydrolase [Solirubrobacterales bacterium]|nr:metal dependent phosphohydrolase [Solirubrobacterales bacterium]
MAVAPAGVEPETNPEVARLLREQRVELSERMSRRERLAELWVGLAFLVAAAGVLVVGDTSGFDPVAALVLLVAYVGAGRVRFEIGGGATDPTLLVLIPALFVEPPATVPLLVAAGCVLARVPDYLSGAAHPEGALAALGNSWHAIGPALVLSLAVDATDPRFADAGWYLLAFATYMAGDAVSGLTRQWAAHGVRPQLQLRMLARVYALDALLAPAGLLAALATAREPYAFLLAVPLVVALGVLSRERGKRLDNALALSETRAQVLEAELEATRARVEVLGAVSHGLQTPVAGIVAISGVLARGGPGMSGEAVAQAAGRLEGDALALRQLVRQALDYVRLVDGEPLGLRVEDVDVAAVAGELADRLAIPPVIALGPGPALARADAVRVHQLLACLLARALAVSAQPGEVRVTVQPLDTAIEVTVAEGGPALDTVALAVLLRAPQGALGAMENQGTGIDLYVAAELAGAMGGTLAAVGGADAGGAGGNRWVVRLPAARSV